MVRFSYPLDAFPIRTMLVPTSNGVGGKVEVMLMSAVPPIRAGRLSSGDQLQQVVVVRTLIDSAGLEALEPVLVDASPLGYLRDEQSSGHSKGADVLGRCGARIVAFMLAWDSSHDSKSYRPRRPLQRLSSIDVKKVITHGRVWWPRDCRRSQSWTVKGDRAAVVHVILWRPAPQVPGRPGGWIVRNPVSSRG